MPGPRFLSTIFQYLHLRRSAVGRVLNVPRRLVRATRYHLPRLGQIAAWSVTSREDTNYTYDLTEQNLDDLAHTLAVVTGHAPARVRAVIDEARDDRALERYVVERSRTQASLRWVSDARCHVGRRLGWYALVRLLRPRVVVETGVDKGLGAVLLCAALLRNEAEGHPGRYYGTDINPEAGALLGAPYDRVGAILYGDSLASLRALAETVDLFINDSDHSADYEAQEYEAIGPKLSPRAVIIGDNAHVTSALARFSERTGRSFLFFSEKPKDHWYPGAGIGVSFVR